MRRHTTIPIPSLAMALTVVACGLALPARAQATDEPATIAEEQLGGTILTLVPRIPYQNAVLRVAGPDGYALTKRFDGAAPINADLLTEGEPRHETDDLAEAEDETLRRESATAGLPEGQYHYEVVFTDSTGERHLHNAAFLVEGGNLVSRDARQIQRDSVGEAPAGTVGANGSAVAAAVGGGVGDFDDLVVIRNPDENGITEVRLQTNDAGNVTTTTWQLFNSETTNNFGIVHNSNERHLEILPGGNVGINTTSPQSRLHVVSSAPNLSALRLENSTGQVWSMGPAESIASRFRFVSRPGTPDASTPFWIGLDTPSNALVARETGVGIGTTEPSADLHVNSLDGAGNTAVRFTNSTETTTWSNAVRPSDGNFVFNRIGSGGAEFTVRQRLDASGPTLDVQGSVRGTQFISTSSREVKTAFEDLQPVDVLAKLAALPVSAWRYVWEDASARHVGPVAEDFQRLFGLGDGKTIGTVDADGVLMAAVQGLKQLLDETRSATAAKDAEISELRRANAELGARLAALEARLPPPSP